MAYIRNRKKRVIYAVFVAYPALIIGFSVAAIISMVEKSIDASKYIWVEFKHEARCISAAIKDKTDE